MNEPAFESMTVTWVRHEDLRRYWADSAPFLQQAIDHSAGEATLDDILARLNAQTMRLMVGHRGYRVEAAFVVNTVLYDQYSALRVILAGGEPLADWLPALVSTLEDECAKMGCEQIELFGRPGFQRALRGWADHQYAVMVRKVPHVGRE